MSGHSADAVGEAVGEAVAGLPHVVSGAQHAAWQAAERALADALPHFEPRAGQRAMMAAVADALWTGADLVVEAGTGTGKTLAYLLPLLAAGRRVIVSTATRQLQGQLVDHDLPTALQATGARVDVAVLKGRSNYLCHERTELTLRRHAVLGGALSPALQAVQLVLRHSATGDIAEVQGVDDQHHIWPEVTSTSDNCLGSDCPSWRSCFVAQARRNAMKATVVVANHHVLLADFALRERFDGAALLPAADVLVIDEAHALEDVASSFFGISLSSARVDRLRRDASDVLISEEAVDQGCVDTAHADLRGFGVAAAQLFGDAREEAAARQLNDPALIRLQAGREQLHRACDALWTSLGGLARTAEPALVRVRENLETLQSDLLALLAPEEGDGMVRWVEARPRTTAIVARPVVVGPVLQRTLLAEPLVRIFTSATLAMGDNFAPFCSRLGLADTVTTLRVPGGFDYPTQALLYLPAHLPLPFQPGREAAVANEIERLVRTSAGGAFALFSSYRGMRDAHNRLRGRLAMPTLLQGDESRDALLARFAERQPAVLFATMGFWQGVDLPGDALRLVILDKIPFPPPDDPLFAARAERVEAEGGSAFGKLSLPAAALSLRQGFGRLIRSRQDSGVVAILDPRMVHKGYGRALIKALPDASRTQDFDDVTRFFEAFHAARTSSPTAQGAPLTSAGSPFDG